ncbi:hypothetical protein [Nitratidesulfovibrio vulgaris]|uniref:hypothetical protein n=1 Tax=Nitratidesulfovibrio vulgaris TaxID=881 RepID=UPI00230189DA|nr:hypothetical protein [Nitratidesulfovibrio vulgaris]WCB45195.1 hypothetical protein PH214_08865 [Nitratidesulfovibrio vulgaris]
MQTDPITRLFTHADALRMLANKTEEECGGLSLIMRLLARDIEQCGEELEAADAGPLARDNPDDDDTPEHLPGQHSADDEADAPHG